MHKKRLFTQLAIAITGCIFFIEVIVLAFSYNGKRNSLINNRNFLEKNIITNSERSYQEIFGDYLSPADIQTKLNRFTVNVTLMVILISLFVSMGTLIVFHFIAGKYLTMILKSNINYNQYKLDKKALLSEKKLPQNELADVIKSRNQMILSIIEYQNEIEQKLDMAKENLVHSAKLSTIGELTSTMIHDIKNPLSIITLKLSLLQKKFKDNENLINHLVPMQLAASRIQQMIKRMGKFSRKENGEFHQFNLNESLLNSLEFLKSKIKQNNIQVKLDIPSNLPINADSIGLEQVFSNLLSNAIDAMDETNEKSVHVKVMQDENQYIITFGDTGPGIAAEKIDNIFEAFFTTKAVGKGTGLGLSSCQRIVKFHHGELRVQNNASVGATFTINLPITQSI